MTHRSRFLAAVALVASLAPAAIVTAGPAHADSGDRWVEGHVVNAAGQPLTNMTALFGWCETKPHHEGCTLIKYQHRSGNDDYNTDQDGYFRLAWPTWKHPAKAGHWVVTINRDPDTMVRVTKPKAGRGAKLDDIVTTLHTGTQLPVGWTGPTLSGTVTGTNGAPIPNAMVYVGGYSFFTDGAGHYAGGIPAGTTGLTMSVQANDYVWYHDVPVIGTFTTDAAVHQDVVLTPKARITGKLEIPRSWRTWRTRVNVHNVENPYGVTYGAYGPGKFELDLDPGAYVLTMKARPRAHSPKVRTATRTVTVTAGQSVELGVVPLHKR